MYKITSNVLKTIRQKYLAPAEAVLFGLQNPVLCFQRRPLKPFRLQGPASRPVLKKVLEIISQRLWDYMLTDDVALTDAEKFTI